MSRTRQLAAIMFTDIVGYTALMQQDEDKAIRARDKHRRIFNGSTQKQNGRILQYYGDGTLSIFDSAIDAVLCGIEMQQELQKDPVIPVRIGIHTGDIIVSEEEIIGDSVNIASRIESLAVGGSILISGKVYDEIKNQESIRVSRQGTFHLKNIKKPVDVYAISNEGIVQPMAGELKGKSVAEAIPSAEKESMADAAVQKQGSTSVILSTKLYIPPPRPKAVQRPHLMELLDRGSLGKLTLISAPAGFGKTTLASEWIAHSKRATAWLSIDEGDNDPSRFLDYLIAALQTISGDIGRDVKALLQSPQPPPSEMILATLLNELAALPNEFTLVLDDYHRIQSKEVNDALSFLLDHLPPHMHLLITTRQDPDLPIGRLRVRGQLTELRAGDLRFSPAEASEFLRTAMGLSLTAEEIDALESRTEGWIAGLQLAALSMQGKKDVSSFVRAFAGHDRYILDYLGGEVLQNQTADVRDFLLQTSVLERLSGPLCDAVCGRRDGQAILESLERSNLFVVPLDNERIWYRYHHLFSDVLLSRARTEHADLIPDLHRRASIWYEQNASPLSSIRHALAAFDFERAAGLIELIWPELDATFQTATFMGWVKQLPDKLVRSRPVLSVAYGWAYLNFGELEDARDRLRDAELWLEKYEETASGIDHPPQEQAYIDEDQFLALPSQIATAHAYISQSIGDVPGTVKHAKRALELVPEHDQAMRGVIAALLAMAYWSDGKLEQAYRTFNGFIETMTRAGNILWAIGPTRSMADIRLVQGRLQEAFDTYDHAHQLLKSLGGNVTPGVAELYLGFSELSYERGDNETASLYLQKCEEMGEKGGLPNWETTYILSRARIKESQGEFEAALRYLEEAERIAFRSPMPVVRPIAAQKARIWIRQGSLVKARQWVEERALSPDDEIIYLNEFEYISLARLLIAEYQTLRESHFISETLLLLDQLLKAAEDGGRMGSAMEILLLQALALEARGDMEAALKPLKRTLELAEPEAYVRLFLDFGKPMEQLLSRASEQGENKDYIGRLLVAFKDEG